MSQSVAKIDGGWVDWQLRDSGPEFDLIPVAVALMAVIPAGAQIHRERGAAGGSRSVHGTRSMPLVAGPAARYEAELIQDLLDRDLGAKLVEIDARHEVPPS